ncbi:MAG: hypothetical protein JXQ72_01645 [Anaerolineae bacterium]|nr:hypothetical protein [Anaerolineae bacterium]
MKHRNFLISIITLILLALALMPGFAGAQGDPTPTVAPLGDFAIPTSTPAPNAGGGGLVVPTATPSSGGGLLIPTATPAAAAEPGLPVLTDDQLASLNVQPGDVPADFAASRETNVFYAADAVASLRDSQYTELADTWEAVSNEYGWLQTTGVSYTSCQPNVPVDKIYSEVSQFYSPAAGRAFFEDVRTGMMLGALGYELTTAETVHGWTITRPIADPTCFEFEIEYTLAFEYWGMYVWVSMTADGNTDPGLVYGLLDQLAAVLVARIDALAAQPFPPTPLPGGESAPPPTQAALVPTNTALPPTWTPVPPTDVPAGATMADVDAVMPALADTGLPSPPFALNQDLSGTYTPDQLVALIRGGNLVGVANAVQDAGQRNGLIGQLTRLWDTGSACPNTVGFAFEIDVALFQTAQGAQAYAADDGIRQAWLMTGLYSDFETLPDGSVVGIGASPFHQCGVVSLYNKSLAHGRFLILISITSNVQADTAPILAALDVMANQMAARLDAAGLE